LVKAVAGLDNDATVASPFLTSKEEELPHRASDNGGDDENFERRKWRWRSVLPFWV